MEHNFHLKEINHQELLMALLSFFGHCEGIGPRGYRYKKDSVDFFLDVQLDKAGKIAKINPSNGFPCGELNKIENKIKEILIDNQILKIGEKVGFAPQRLEGCFRYKDLFQIIPVPDAAPNPPKMMLEGHPFLLQFSYTSCPNMLINLARQKEKSTIYVMLLNLFSNVGITLGPRYARFFWTVCEREPNNVTSEWKCEGYSYKSFPRKTDEYTPIDNFSPIRRVPYENYYKPLAKISNLLDFPDNLEKSFDLAFSLNPEDWKKIFTACSWYYQATDIWKESNSSAFIALVSAIECLIDKPKKEVCKYCGQQKYGVTKGFKEFLKKYTPSFERQFPREKELIYKVRSSLSHGLDMLMRDIEPWYFATNVRAEEQDTLQRNLSFIARTAIYNWLWNRS
jgi:hypothetical protein